MCTHCCFIHFELNFKGKLWSPFLRSCSRFGAEYHLKPSYALIDRDIDSADECITNFPVETAPSRSAGRDILEGNVVDYIDYWANNSGSAFLKT